MVREGVNSFLTSKFDFHPTEWGGKKKSFLSSMFHKFSLLKAKTKVFLRVAGQFHIKLILIKRSVRNNLVKLQNTQNKQTSHLSFSSRTPTHPLFPFLPFPFF
uniref:Uncharacterized protein n=1 Tax=Octopus bimaculoides TaxID=37653 RepID=A0A0L8GEX6_OCTBM